MPVNNSTSINHVQANCSLVTAAGIMGFTYQDTLPMLGHQLTDDSFHATYRVEHLLARWEGSLSNTTFNDDTELPLQISGMERLLNRMRAVNIQTYGTINAPLTMQGLLQAMSTSIGNYGAVLVGRSEGLTHFVGGTHWIGAFRNNQGEVWFRDYQTDIDPAPFINANLRGSLPVPDHVALNVDRRSRLPKHAWGRHCNLAEDKFILIACSR